MADEFRSWICPTAGNLFEELLASAWFEDLGKGRRGTVLVRCDDRGAVPIVRTTTAYRAPAQSFLDVHDHLAQDLQRAGSLPQAFTTR